MRYELAPENWVKNYGDMLLQFACLRVSDRETARDLVQETFFAALRNKETYKGELSEKNWLFLILKNKIIDIYKNKSRQLINSLDEIEESMGEFFDESGHWKPGSFQAQSSANSETNILSEEFNILLQKCMNRLQELMRICFVLKYLDDKEAEEICKELAISSSNYWVLVHRAKLSIRKCLEKNGMQIQ